MSILLLAAPLAGFSASAPAVSERCYFRTLQPNEASPKKGESAKTEAATGTSDKPAISKALPAEPPTALNLTPPPIDKFLLSAPLQVLVNDSHIMDNFGGNQPPVAEPMPELVVETSTSGQLPFAVTNTPCGIASIAWSFAHPAEAWRELAPLPVTSDTDTCLRSEVLVDHLPAALASVRWYQ